MSDRLSRYEARTTNPLLILALGFLVVYGAPVIWPDLPAALRMAFEVANWAIWAIFAADLITRTALSDQRLRYLARHPIDVIVVLVPALRTLRVLRAFTAAQILVTRSGQVSLLKTTQAIAFATGLLVLIGALAILDAEGGAPGSTIESFGDALWWSLVTVTTVGYGDLVPATGIGQFVAAGLMLVGISLLGVVTATVASWFLGQAQAATEQGQQSGEEGEVGAAGGGSRDAGHAGDSLERKIAALEQRLEQVHGLLSDAHAEPGSGGGSGSVGSGAGSEGSGNSGSAGSHSPPGRERPEP